MVNENIKKMADLLRSGSTMLNMACPICNNPTFRNKNGIIFCPTCNRKVLIANSQNHSNERTEILHNKEPGTNNQNKQIEILSLLQDVLFEKLEMITDKLKNETHLQLIETYTKMLLNLLDLLNKISVKRDKL